MHPSLGRLWDQLSSEGRSKYHTLSLQLQRERLLGNAEGSSGAAHGLAQQSSGAALLRNLKAGDSTAAVDEAPLNEMVMMADSMLDEGFERSPASGRVRRIVGSHTNGAASGEGAAGTPSEDGLDDGLDGVLGDSLCSGAGAGGASGGAGGAAGELGAEAGAANSVAPSLGATTVALASGGGGGMSAADSLADAAAAIAVAADDGSPSSSVSLARRAPHEFLGCRVQLAFGEGGADGAAGGTMHTGA